MESSCFCAKSKAEATVFSSLTFMPDQVQNLDTTARRRFMSSADSVQSTRSSANPRAGVLNPVNRRCATPVVRSATNRQLKIKSKSKGDNLSPCLVPLVRGIGADLP